MKSLLLGSSTCLYLALALARVLSPVNPVEAVPEISESYLKQGSANGPKEAANLDGQKLDFTQIDRGKGEVDNVPVPATVAPDNEDVVGDTPIDEEDFDIDWDKLEVEDEYVFSKDGTTVPKVPKNEKASDDIFYVQPLNISSYLPGHVLRMREVVPAVYLANVRAVYQYMVRSTDSLDQAVGIVSTIYVSKHADGKKLLSFQVPTDSPCIDCAPSVDMEDSMKKLEKPFEFGWNVIAPDFQGLHAAFGAARLAGQATLDAVRGALVTENVTGIAPTAQFAMWGYSGGSIATGWAATLQPLYAPELGNQLVGAAVGGWITNYDTTIKAADGNLAAGLVGLALSGLAQQYTDLVPIYKKYIRNTFRLKSVLVGAKKACLTSGILRFLGAQFFKGPRPYFKGGDKALQEPRVVEIIEENRVAFREETGMPQCPFFLHHALKDNIAPLVDTKRAVKNYCDWGIGSFEVHYVKNTGHMSESREGVPAVLTWLAKRFEGAKAVQGCKEQTWKSLQDYPGINRAHFKRDYFEESPPANLNDEDAGYDEQAEFVRGILPLP